MPNNQMISYNVKANAEKLLTDIIHWKFSWVVCGRTATEHATPVGTS